MTHYSLNSANQTLGSVGNTDWITMDTVKDCDVETRNIIWASKIYNSHTTANSVFCLGLYCDTSLNDLVMT